MRTRTRRSPFLARTSLLVLLALPGGTARAGASPAGAAEDSERRIESLEGKIEVLEAEIQRLKGASAAAGTSEASAARDAEADRKIEALTREIEKLRIGTGEAGTAEGAVVGKPGDGRHGLGPAASKVYNRTRGVSIGGYGEVLFQGFADEREDGSPSEARNRLDLLRGVLYTGYKFTDTVLFNSELEVEHATTGEGDEEKGEVSLEFAYLDFLWKPEVSVRAGLMLMPIGFLNELHEPTTFLGARRPEVETALLLSTWRETGVGVFGEWDKLSYRAYLVNGLNAEEFGAEGLREGRQGGSNALAEDFAFTGRLDFHPTLGSLVGASVFTGNAAQGEPGVSAHTTIFDLHGELRHRGLEVRALYAEARVGDAARLDQLLGLEGEDSIGSSQRGGYVEAGYDVLTLTRSSTHSLTPFVRFETLDTQEEVPAGFARNGANDRSIWTLGASWKPLPQIVVKADYQGRSDEADTAVDQFNLALGYIF